MLENLSPRELEILSLMAQGKTDSEIMAELCIERCTTCAHIGRIYSKLNPSSIQERASQRVKAVLIYLKEKGKLNG